MARLRKLEAEHQEVASVVEDLQTDILGHDESKGGEQLRRHAGNCDRMLHRNLAAINKGRRERATSVPEIDDKSRPNDDDLLVVDEQGLFAPPRPTKGTWRRGWHVSRRCSGGLISMDRSVRG